MSLSVIQKNVHENAVLHGFWSDLENQNIPTKMMLIVSEISEALEAFRDPKLGYSAIEEELADAIIRILDLGEFLGMDLEKAVLDKAEYNKNRPYKHGGKRV